jgi:hypothetical protein
MALNDAITYDKVWVSEWLYIISIWVPLLVFRVGLFFYRPQKLEVQMDLSG